MRRWFRRGIRKDPALKKEARYQEAFLAWFPFVRARLDAVGWVLGIREKKRKRGNRWETVKEPVERQVERAVDLTMPAADMAEFGVHRVDLSGDESNPSMRISCGVEAWSFVRVDHSKRPRRS